tara:strand:- start:9321 stop:10607 length:1287 start_codon:yes stop_codon:yes gene_type:complete
MFSLFLIHVQTFSQEDDFYNPNHLRYENKTYNDNIKTVQLFRSGWNEAFPVINLNQSHSLYLTFDDLSDNLKNLGYTFIHCTSDWTPSDMMKVEYLNGLEDNLLSKYGFSSTMYQTFIKYELTFPNQDVQFTKSGNYLLVVYDLDNEDQPILTRRFFVAEYFTSIIPNIHRPTQGRYRQNSHEVDFTISQSQIQLIQPFSTMKVVITQNQNWNNAITNLKPKFINGNKLIYDYDEENIFPAGNQFRVVDIRNINYNSLTTSHIATINDSLNAYIFPDKPRSSMVYLTTPDINGHFYLKNDDIRFDSDLESEYMNVHLALLYPNKLYKADIYLYGQLTGWAFDDAYKMKWNPEKKSYETNIYLKQGYYNYLYLYKPQDSVKGDVAIIEGSHVETDNEYSFFVYYKEPGQIYERLIGYNTVVYPDYSLNK